MTQSLSGRSGLPGHAGLPGLPVEEIIPDLRRALINHRAAVLVAPPGAGKTTRIPLALSEEPWLGGRRIIMLEPRRLAARAAATELSRRLGEPLGKTVGLRARMMSRVSEATRIEVVTEGVFARMVLDDPELSDIGLVIFDEFHERSLDADFGLALALDCQSALNQNLKLLVMSATLDGARVADCLGGAPVINSSGRMYPVETYYLERPATEPLEAQVCRAVRRALAETDGSVLVFLPGQAQIRRTDEALARSDIGVSVENSNVIVHQLHGGLHPSAQDAAIAPPSPGARHIILATSIAETSLTIDSVSAVVDSGLARVPRLDVGARLTRLRTERVSLASAEQRRGRAGRVGPGHCYRLWAEPETASLAQFAPPEILSSDLTGLLLDCAAWGVTDPTQLTWLDPPPEAATQAARDDLIALEALDEKGRITPFGQRIRSLPLPPPLAVMVTRAAEAGEAHRAALLAALIVERGLGGKSTDLEERYERFSRDKGQRAKAVRQMAGRWAAGALSGQAAEREASRTGNALTPGALVALAYPDRIAKSRGAGGRYLMAGGRGGILGEDEPLSGARFLVIADLQGDARAARIMSAAPISETDIETHFAARIRTETRVEFDATRRAVRGRHVKRFGAIVLGEEPVAVEPGPSATAALVSGIKRLGAGCLPWTRGQTQLRQRVQFLRSAVPDDWPDLCDDALANTLDTWLAPFIEGKTEVRQITGADLEAGLNTFLDYAARKRVDAAAPTHFLAPTAERHAVDYSGEHAPSVSLRVQELFGLTSHPAIADGRLALTLILLSPAGRPIQVTRDLPGFWSGSWRDVRADLRGRYPKHPWPEDPANAAPTRRAKRRT